jgi:CRP/FNR family transcriptional regulator, cyclic AMP receptor protein
VTAGDGCALGAATQPCHGVGVTDALERFAREVPAGEVLFEEGQPGHDMYIVTAGEVELRRQVGDSERVLAVLSTGEFFGEMAILSGRPRSATAIVRSDARLLVIDGTTFEAMLRARPEIALRIIRALASRLDSANHHVELLLLPTANHRVVQCLRHFAEEQLQHSGARGLRRTLPDDLAFDDTNTGAALGHGTAIFVPRRAEDIAERVGLGLAEVCGVLDRLRAAQLVLTARDAGIDSEGFVVPEVGRLLEFLEFLQLRDRFGG